MLTHEQKVGCIFHLMKTRALNPDGSFDKAGRFYPSHSFDCCIGLRQPTRSYPYSLMTHCRTKKHIDSLLSISPNMYSDLLRYFDLDEIPLMVNDYLVDFHKAIVKNVLEGKYTWLKKGVNNA